MSLHFERITLFILLIFFSIRSSANAKNSCSLYSQSGFIPIKEIADVLTTSTASVSIKFLLKNGQWEDCSGAVVSDQGHIMTAGHCFENCSATKEKELNPYEAYSSLANSYNAKKVRPSKCIAKIDGVETTVDVKLTSACSFEEHQAAAGHNPPQKCSNFNEVAVVLPQMKLMNKNCLPLAPSYKVGDRVYTIGYPSRTDRGERDSDGHSQYASFGEIIPYSQKCMILKNTWDADKRRKVEQPGDLVDFDSFLNSEMKYCAIQTTVDVVPGNSGGPLINQNGEIIAVGSFGDTQKNNEYKLCRGSTFFSPISGINSTVSHFVSDFKLSDLVCKEHKVQSAKKNN